MVSSLFIIGWSILSLMTSVVYREIGPPVVYAAIPEEKPDVRVVMVTAKWCGWCQRWKASEQPKLKERGWSFGGADQTVQFMDTDKEGNPYRVSGLPAFVFLKDDKVVSKLIGFHSASVVEATFKRHSE